MAISCYFCLFPCCSVKLAEEKESKINKLVQKNVKTMDKTIEIDDSTEKTIILDSSKEENNTIDIIDSSSEEEQEHNGKDEEDNDHFTTASTESRFLESPPKVTSTPNIPPPRSTNVTLFHEVEDEFANDDSFDDAAIVKMGPPMENTTESVLKKVESVSDDSNSNDTPVETQRQITSSDSESEESSSEGPDEVEEDDDKSSEKDEKNSEVKYEEFVEPVADELDDPVEEESEEEKCYQLSVKANVVNTEPVKNANDEIQDTKQEKNEPVEEESDEEVKANVVNTESAKKANDEVQETKQEKNEPVEEKLEEEVKRNVVNTEVPNNAIHETILEKNGDVKTIEVEPVQQKTDLPSSASNSRENLEAEESTQVNHPIDLNDEKNIEQEKEEISDQHIENNEKVQDDEPLDKPNISEGPLTTTVEDSTLNVDSNISEKEISFEQVSEGSLESDTDGQDQIETDADDEVKDGEDDEEIEGVLIPQPSGKSSLNDPPTGSGRPDMENPELPETCTMLTTSQGAKIFIVGTAHFSRSSHEDVSTVMRKFLPDVVVLELCKSRTNILSLDEATLLSESENLNMNKVMQILKEYGKVQGLMYVLLLSMSASLTKTLGMAPGGEFRRAFNEANEIPGCVVHLGDRPIQITLKRALATLTTWQKIKLAVNVLTSSDKITPEEVEKMKQKDLLESLLEEMAGEYPEMSKVFVEERDTFLAYSLKQAALEIPIHDATRPREPRVVVGVVGLGHVAGIVNKFESVTSQEVEQVISIPPPSKSAEYMKIVFRIGFYSLAAYGVYRFAQKISSKQILSKLISSK